MNPVSAEVDNAGDDNDRDELEQESPGMAAKKARLRQGMKKLKKVPGAAADETRALPRNRAGASGSIEKVIGGTVDPLKALAGNMLPAEAGAQEGLAAPMAPVMQNPVVDPNASIKQAMRQAESSGDTATIRRMLQHLMAARKVMP